MVELSESWRTSLKITSGTRSTSDIMKNVTSGGVNFARDQISELDLKIEDRGLTFFRSGVFNRKSTVTYGGLRFVVTGVSVAQEDAGAVVSLTAMAKVVHSLQKQTGAKSWGNITIPQFVKAVAKSAGAKGYRCQPFTARKQIARQKSSDSSQKESTWDVLQRLADENGAWCWEAAGIIYFGKPSWFAKNYRAKYSISWTNESTYSVPLKQMPNYSTSETSDPRESLDITLHSKDGDNIRPGDMFKLSGNMGQANGDWIVTDLDIPFEKNPEITVNLKRPIDPPPQQAAV